MLEFVPIATVDPAAVEALLDRAFGRDRHAKTAYRLREGVAPIPELSFAAIEDGVLAGTIQCWPVEIAGDDGDVRPLVLVGPVAVEPARQRGGLGKELMHQALDAAVELDLDGAMMLVGDPEYYGRFWGFSAEATARLAACPARSSAIACSRAAPMCRRSAACIGPRVAVAA